MKPWEILAGITIVTMILIPSAQIFDNLYPSEEPAPVSQLDRIEQTQQEQNELLRQILENTETVRVSVTGYTLSPSETDSTPNISAINERPVAGKTAAVSRDLAHLLGKKIYVPGVGVRRINDLTNARLSNTIDVLVSNKQQAKQIGNDVKTVRIL